MKIKIKENKKYFKIHQQLNNISEMLNSRVYNLLIEFADMRGEIRELRMSLMDIEHSEKEK